MPTIVLVHGAFAESSSWNGVISRLLDEDHQVIAVANPLRGVAADSAYLRSVLEGIEGPIVLAAHSYGGMLTTNAATGNANVRALVFIAAFAPDQGESAADLSGRYPGSTLAETLVPSALPDGGTDLYIARDRYHQQFVADAPADVARLMAAGQRPITEAALGERSPGEPAWRSIPSWFIFGSEDRNIPSGSHRFMAERAGPRRILELAGASHAFGVVHDEVVAGMIAEAATATAPSAV